MKITFLRQYKTAFGGAENYLARLCTELEKQHISYEIMNAYAPKFFASWIKALLFNLQVRWLKNDKFYFSLERITCPDIYRAGDGVHKVYIRHKQRRFSFNLLNYVYCYLEKRCFENAKHIIANSHFIEQQIIETYHIAPSKISVVYNGIPLPKPFCKNECRQALLKAFGYDTTLPVILFVGSGFERKGVKEALQTLSHIKTPFHAFIVGKEKNIDTYKTFAAQLGLSSCVTFTGPRKDAPMFYKGSDIFLFPTHYEPFSNVVLEAMSYANVVFTTAQNGASEILESRFVMNTPQDVSIIETLDTLLLDKEFLEKEQEKNYRHAQTFSIENNVKQTLEVIHAHLH